MKQPNDWKNLAAPSSDVVSYCKRDLYRQCAFMPLDRCMNEDAPASPLDYASPFQTGETTSIAGGLTHEIAVDLKCLAGGLVDIPWKDRKKVVAEPSE